jgi:hemolysin III
VFFTGLGVVLVASADEPRQRAAGAVFAACVALTFGVSALYHRVTWRPAARRIMRRLDHATIYLLIAGTYTPVGVLALTGGWRVAVLAVVWTGCLAAIVHSVAVPDGPKWVSPAFGVAVGWVGIVVVPQIHAAAGWAGLGLLLAGGFLYTLGAVVYVLRRPDPAPLSFGYHEVFHALTILAAASQYAAIAVLVLR